MPDKLYQYSLAGGELAPSLWGRVDLAKYRTGLKRLYNFIIHPHGGVSNRPGLQFIEEVKDSGQPTRIFRFVASTNDAYILEFGNLYMRVFRNGARVIIPPGPTLFELALPYATADLADLRIVQSNDVLTLTHPSFPVREIARYDHHDWRTTLVSWTPVIAAPTMGAVAVQSNYTSTAGATPSVNYVATVYKYKVTTVASTGEESLPSTMVQATTDLKWYPSNYTRPQWSAVTGAIRYNVYKEENGLYGLIGTTPNVEFEDKNYKPNLADSPPEGRNPFGSAGNYPSVAAFYQQRRVFAATNLHPQTVWGTVSANYYNMSVSIPSKDSDAFEFTIAAQSIQKVRHMVALEDLILFTTSGEWKVTGTKDDVVTPTSIALKPQSAYGASDVPPVVIGDQILFVQEKGNQVRDLGYKYEVNRYTGADLSILSSHLFRDRTIVRWGYAQAPDSIMWCVMSDGTLLSLTYMREHEVWGWAQHETDGIVEDVAVIPDGEYDAAYFVILRQVDGQQRRYIEKLKHREFDDRTDCFFIDSGLSYDEPIMIESVGIGLSTTVNKAAHGLVDGDTVDIETTYHGFGDALDGVFFVLNATADTFEIRLDVDVAYDTSGLDLGAALIVFRKRVSIVSGLDHLEGRAVVGLLDGAVVGTTEDQTLRVVGGEVTLPKAAAKIHLGLPYSSELVSLELTRGDGSVARTVKNVAKVKLIVEETSGISAGPDLDSLQLVLPREGENYNVPPTLQTGEVEVVPPTGWRKLGSIAVRQTDPLPARILALAPEVEYGG